ncbi:MAG: hypothetical protein K0M66_11065 [Thiobacillus sp.]|nr:hypothetical protein [Thiobacillus sp.]
MNKTIASTDEAWDERILGADEAFVKVSEVDIDQEIDAAAGTQLISIRMQKTMIEDLKTISALNGGMGYQTLMKQILQRFIDGEKRQFWNAMVAEKLKEHQAQAECATKPSTRKRRAA